MSFFRVSYAYMWKKMMVCYSASVVTTSVTELGGPRGLQLRLGGVYLRDWAHDGLGGACLRD